MKKLLLLALLAGPLSACIPVAIKADCWTGLKASTNLQLHDFRIGEEFKCGFKTEVTLYKYTPTK